MKIHTITITFESIADVYVYTSLYLENHPNSIFGKIDELIESAAKNWNVDIVNIDFIKDNMKYKHNKYVYVDPSGWIFSFHLQEL